MSLPLAAFLTVWSFLALNILSPGPNVLNTITTAMGSGRRAGIASACGVGLGIGLWCLAMSLGMATLFRLAPGAQAALTLVAAVLLVWFGSRFLRAALGPPGARQAQLKAQAGLSFRRAFLRSLSINATNPKALTTWTVILGLFPTASAAAGDIALLTLGACCLSLTIHTGYAVLFSTGPAARLYLRASPVINGGVGLFFLGFAGKLLADLWGG